MRNVVGNSEFRPSLTGSSEHEDSVGTIVLFTKNETSDSYKGSKNFIQDFATPIASNPNSSGIDGNSGIPNLKLDGKNDYYGVFNNFSISGVSESRDQIVKIQNHFGGNWSAYFFGEKPKIFSFNGIFLDSKEYPYYQEFITAYEKYLSGRKCVENNYQMTISYDNKLIKGYILNISTTANAAERMTKRFSFSILVEAESWVRYNLVDGKEALNAMSNTSRLESMYVNKSDASNPPDINSTSAVNTANEDNDQADKIISSAKV